MASSTGKKGNRKAGRNMRKPTCARYKAEMRWLKNKAKKLRKHLKKYPNDTTAIRALKFNT